MKKSVIEVRFHPIRKNANLGPMKVFHTTCHPGESLHKAADRVLTGRYRVRDYLIMDVETVSGLHQARADF